MSSCLVLQGKNFIAIGADTASSIMFNGCYKRIGTNAKKLYHFGNEIMFCSGRMDLVESVTSNTFLINNKIDLNKLTKFINSMNIKKSDTYDLEILICGVENNKSYIHQISQYNNFKVKTITNETNGCAVYSTGFNSKLMLSTAKKNYSIHKNITNLFIRSFEEISSEEVGGYMNMYLIQENQITKCIDEYKVDDIKPIKIETKDVHFVVADVLIGDLIAGETLMISNGSKTFIVDKDGIIVNNMKLDMYSADKKHRILIDPDLKSMFNIYNEDKQVFFVDENGNVTMFGNLCVENKNLYCNINMDADNIIEVGYKNNNEEIIETKWVKVCDGLNLTDLDWDYDGSKNCFYDQNKCTTKNGEIYIIYKKKIKHWNKNDQLWEIVYDLSGVFKNQHENSFCFIDNIEDDSNLYIYNINQNNSDIKWIIKYNIDNGNEAHFKLEVDTGETAYPKYLFYNSDTLYMYDAYTFYKINLIDGIENCWNSSSSANITSEKKEPIYSERKLIQDIIIYNNELYLLYLSELYNKLQLYKVISLNTQNIKFLCEVSISANQFTNLTCNTCVVNDELYIVPITDKPKNKKTFIYNFKKNTISESVALPNSVTYSEGNDINDSYYYFPCRGSLMFYDGNYIHLFSSFKEENTSVKVESTNIYYESNLESKLSAIYLQHFILKSKETSDQFLEKQYGNNFNISSQSAFTQIGDAIYSINTSGNFYRNAYVCCSTTIKVLDTTSEDANWKTIGTSDVGIVGVNMVQSDSSDNVYFIGTVKGSKYNYTLYEVDIKTGSFTDLINKNGTTNSSIVSRGGFGFYFSQKKQLVLCRTSKTIIDIETNTKVSNEYSHIPFVSNNIWDSNNENVYSIAIEDNVAYLCKLSLVDDTFVKLSKILDYANEDYGFSIVLYNQKIYIYYSICGALSSDWYLYTIENGSLIKRSDMFYSEGLHMPDRVQSYTTCYLPAIATSNGIHFFCGNNEIDGLNGNGGYMHVVYSQNNEGIDVKNPLGNKLLYVTNQGDLNLYGNIHAKSLTLGSNVTIDTVNIKGLDDRLKDINDNFEGISNNVIYAGDIITTTEKLENGIIKTTNRVPTGKDSDGNIIYEDNITYTSADGNYVMTDVGLGDKEKESGAYVVISKEGLLEAVNAKVSGTIYATAGKFGGWDVGKNGLKSELFDDASNTNGIRLDSNGEIRSKGSWYSSVNNDGSDGWFARLCSGKWIFGYYDKTQSDPFIPPANTPYSDISVNGIYMCSRDAIQNKNTQYLFEVNTLNDTVNITNSSKSSPALTITNNYYDNTSSYDAPALVLHSPKQGYRNRPLDVRLKVTGKLLGTEQTVDAQYSVALFGEEQLGRIIFRSNTFDTTSSPVGNTVSDTSSNPTVPSILGSDTFRWYQGYFMELYSKNGVNTSSDRKIKNHIDYMDGDKSLEFVNQLKPVEYTLKNNANKRKHMGFYAQDVKDVAESLEMGNMSLYSAVWNKDGNERYYSEDAPDEELSWTLKYEEFIAPLVGSVQELTKRDKENKDRINKLEDTVESLLSEIKSLKEQMNK